MNTYINKSDVDHVEQGAKEELDKFLTQWDESYAERMQQIDLFKPDLTSCWSNEQKQLFACVLYHQRAHFDDVLWFMGSFAPSREAKEMIIKNTEDEFGMNGVSHEMLYLEFAKALGVDLTYELIDENYYFSFLRSYNHGHLKWLRDHDWDHRLAAFAAIERLDNLDYVSLRSVAQSIGLRDKALVFFNVHIYVQHYEQTQTIFSQLWEKNPQLIKEVFMFIGDYQLEIWRKISDAVFKGYYLEKCSSAA